MQDQSFKVTGRARYRTRGESGLAGYRITIGSEEVCHSDEEVLVKKEAASREKEISELRAEAHQLLMKAERIEQQFKEEEVRPQMRESVGDCYKYSNSYGSGDRWWLYIKILSFCETDCTFETVQFQTTSAKSIQIEYRKHYNFEQRNYFSQSSYVAITNAEYDAAKKKLLNFVTKSLGL